MKWTGFDPQKNGIRSRQFKTARDPERRLLRIPHSPTTQGSPYTRHKQLFKTIHEPLHHQTTPQRHTLKARES